MGTVLRLFFSNAYLISLGSTLQSSKYLDIAPSNFNNSSFYVHYSDLL